MYVLYIANPINSKGSKNCTYGPNIKSIFFLEPNVLNLREKIVLVPLILKKKKE